MFSVVLAVLTLGQDCQQAQRLARIAYDERRYDQAAAHFTDAVTACGANAPLLLALAQAQLLAQRPADSIKSLDRIRSDSAEYVAALKVKAKALYFLARDAEAEDTLKLASARAPQDAEIPYSLGRIYYQQS